MSYETVVDKCYKVESELVWQDTFFHSQFTAQFPLTGLGIGMCQSTTYGGGTETEARCYNCSTKMGFGGSLGKLNTMLHGGAIDSSSTEWS